MIRVSEFLPSLRLLVDVPLPGLMERAIIQASIRFCRESRSLVKRRSFEEVFELQTISAISRQYDIKGIPQLKGAGLISVSSQSQLLEAGVDYTVLGLDKITFQQDFIDVEIYARAEPTQSAAMLPEELYHDYCDVICSGAAAILQMQPNQTWTGPNLAKYNEQCFVEGYRQAFRHAVEHQSFTSRPERKRVFI
ncbi:hypothetical protein [Photobacterium damselae]|uniref:Uncharacterized protein n=2 Tax=Photobacterium damselae TaxID=38293 RepID=D0Z3B5_PHODD|nr:hypothetical protein [Photobacterium damselae]EEZ39896.1 hypothetical protein VDA_000916 [Photobacterium damselae subsp. damselae CIP 102761]SPY44022.1 Uncharacterised protein [Photobacterium damselae]